MSDSDQAIDAVVIGAGPAGAVAARCLAMHGWSVALVEKGSGRHAKACGHCLGAQAWQSIERLGLRSVVAPLVHRALDRLVLAHPARSASVDLSATPSALVPRPALDQALRAAAVDAGVTLHLATHARLLGSVHRRAQVVLSHPSGKRTLTTSLVIGADGLRSRVARAIGIAHHVGRRRAFGVAFDRSVDAEDPRLHDVSTIGMFMGEAGYIGTVRPSPDRVHVGALIRPIPGRPSLIDALRDLAAPFDALAPLALTHRPPDSISACSPMPCRPTAVACGPVVLVGDAAGYVEPFTGQGIGWALLGAEALAEVLATTTPGRWIDTCADQYANTWVARLRGAQRHCARLGWALRHAATRRAMVTLPRVIPPIGAFVSRRTVG